MRLPRNMIVQSGGKVRYPALTSDFEHETELVVAMRSGRVDIKADDTNRHIFGFGNDMVGTINGPSTLVVDIV